MSQGQSLKTLLNTFTLYFKGLLISLFLFYFISSIHPQEIPVKKDKELAIFTYNMHNLFDLDLISDFKEYQWKGSKGYGPLKLLHRLQNFQKLLLKSYGKKGPDILILQEVEYDFTPPSTPNNYSTFLKKNPQALDQYLKEDLKSIYRDWSATQWLLKALEDINMESYHVAEMKLKRDRSKSSKMPHVNLILSKYPILKTISHRIREAREILECHIDIDGHRLIVFNNHWKSNRGGVHITERIRLDNARVLKRRIEACLSQYPQSDLLIAGDLNTHYNQHYRFPDIQTTALRDILKVTGSEQKLITNNSSNFYNLWYELKPHERYSDTYQSNLGTLMHIILHSNLYDSKHIQYIDQSFEVLRYPLLNADMLGLPLRPHHSGKVGGGHSDHFPLSARFKILSKKQSFNIRYLGTESKEDKTLFKNPYKLPKDLSPLNANLLSAGPYSEVWGYIGHLFKIKAIVSKRRLSIHINKRAFDLYSPNPKLQRKLKNLGEGETFEALGVFESRFGRRAFRIEHESWIDQPSKI